MPGISKKDEELIEQLYLEPLCEQLQGRGFDVTCHHSLVQHLTHRASHPGFGEKQVHEWFRKNIEELLERAKSGKVISQTAPMEWLDDPKALVLTFEQGEVRIHARPGGGKPKSGPVAL